MSLCGKLSRDHDETRSGLPDVRRAEERYAALDIFSCGTVDNDARRFCSG
jgi:hypothetical protein